MTNKQFVIGSSNTDLVIYLDRIPKIGETVMGGSSSIIYGGKGANQAVSIKKAGGNVNSGIEFGRTPLHEAGMWNSNSKVIFALIDMGADIFVDNN